MLKKQQASIFDPVIHPFFAIFLIFLFFTGCGRKGAPVPPEETVHEKVQLKTNMT